MISGGTPERELKFSAVQLPQLRERLLELEAERISTASFEDNWIFDRQGELAKAGHVLRLRIDGQGAVLTLKGPVGWDDETKVRDELQTRVDDADEMRAILENLGYRVRRQYQKMREQWRIGAVVICLDHTPIGDFVEFEGQGADRLARRCGLQPEQAEKRTYLELYEEHLKLHPELPPDMVFRERSAEK